MLLFFCSRSVIILFTLHPVRSPLPLNITCMFRHFNQTGLMHVLMKTGENVTLRCWSTTADDITLIEWSRPDLNKDNKHIKTEIFVWRKGELIIAECHQSYRGRVELKDPKMKNGNASVILKNVNINDTGTYESRVGYTGPPQLINTTNLTVVEPAGSTGDEVGGVHLGLLVSLMLVIVLLVISFAFWTFRKCTFHNVTNHPPDKTVVQQQV
uniref:Ig-like domain-containing protein n=1 Tax=Anabas testudineus TaxID=64144 RepID=A0A3Q1IS29_ANATE